MRATVIISLSLFLVMMIGCQSSSTKEESVKELVTVSIDVKGMTCEGCESAIVKNLEKIEGVEEASASHKDSSALVSFDQTKTSLQDIELSIEKTGYHVGGHTFESGL